MIIAERLDTDSIPCASVMLIPTTTTGGGNNE